MSPGNLANQWEKEAAQYMRQVEEARRAGTPSEGMLAQATVLRQCAKDLRAASFTTSEHEAAAVALLQRYVDRDEEADWSVQFGCRRAPIETPLYNEAKRFLR